MITKLSLLLKIYKEFITGIGCSLFKKTFGAMDWEQLIGMLSTKEKVEALNQLTKAFNNKAYFNSLPQEAQTVVVKLMDMISSSITVIFKHNRFI